MIQVSPAPKTLRSSRVASGVLLAVFGACEAARLFKGGVPVLATGDSTVFMNDARRLLEGQAIYRDFFQFTTPGAPVAYWAVFRVFGVHAWVENVVMLALAIGLVWLAIEMSRQVLEGWAAVVAPLLVGGLLFRYYRDATHHWFSAVTIAAAIACVLPGRTTRRLIAAGVLCGVTALFTQNKGAGMLIGLSTFLCWEGWPEWREAVRHIAVLVGAAGATFLLLMAPFLVQSGVGNTIEHIVVFPLQHYSGVYSNSWQSYMADWPDGFGGKAVYALVYGTVPLIFVLALIRSRSLHVADDVRGRIALLSCVGAGLFVASFPAANGYRIASIAYVGFVLLAWTLAQGGFAGKAAAALLAVAGMAGLLAPLRTATREMELPIGRVAVPVGAFSESIAWAKTNTSSGEAFVGNPVLAFAMLYRTPPALLYPSDGRYTTIDQYENLVSWSESNRPRFMVLHPSALLPVYPTQGPDTAAVFCAYLGREYVSIGHAGDEEIFRARREAQSAGSDPASPGVALFPQ